MISHNYDENILTVYLDVNSNIQSIIDEYSRNDPFPTRFWLKDFNFELTKQGSRFEKITIEGLGDVYINIEFHPNYDDFSSGEFLLSIIFNDINYLYYNSNIDSLYNFLTENKDFHQKILTFINEQIDSCNDLLYLICSIMHYDIIKLEHFDNIDWIDLL